METTFNKLDRVWNLDVGLGTVHNIRDDGRGIPILTIALDDATQTPDGWYIAREWEVLSQFQFLMLKLDCALTGKTRREVAQQMHHKFKTPVAWFEFGREWYLSDGGYSRVILDADDAHLFLDSVSTDRVKAAWPEAAGLVAEVEQFVRQALQAAGQIE